MSKKRKHTTTKNTNAKPPVTRLRVMAIECNGYFELVTDFQKEKDFFTLFDEWFNHPKTSRWCAESLIAYIKEKQPKRICLLKEDYDNITKGKAIPSTEEEWLAENN